MKDNVYKEQLKFLSDHLSGKTVLVSGSTGLVGTRIMALLSLLHKEYDRSIRGIGLYRSESKLHKVFPTVPEGIEMSKWDSDSEGMPEVAQYDAIIHCAGISGGKKMHLKDPRKFFFTNVCGTRKLLDLNAQTARAPFLFVSTYEVYGDVQQEEQIKEDHPVRLDTFTLRNCYAEMKRMCEMMCCMWSSQFGFDSYSVRLTSTFGTGVEYDDPRFFAEFARCIIEERDIVLKSAGGTVRSYLDADDAAVAMLRILSAGQNGNAYNLTNMGNAISIRDIARQMIDVSKSGIGLKFDIAEDSTKLGFRKEGCTLMDASKLMALGWEPVYTLDETILKMINSMRNHRENN